MNKLNMDKRGGNDKQIIQINFWGKTMISNIQVSPVKNAVKTVPLPNLGLY